MAHTYAQHYLPPAPYTPPSYFNYGNPPSNLTPPPPVPMQHMDPVGLKKVECWYRVLKAVLIVALALFGLTIAFLGLSQAGMMPLLSPLYSFSAFAATLLAAIFVDICRRYVSRSYGIDPIAYDKNTYPTEEPKKEEDKSKSKNDLVKKQPPQNTNGPAPQQGHQGGYPPQQQGGGYYPPKPQQGSPQYPQYPQQPVYPAYPYYPQYYQAPPQGYYYPPQQQSVPAQQNQGGNNPQ